MIDIKFQCRELFKYSIYYKLYTDKKNKNKYIVKYYIRSIAIFLATDKPIF